MKPKTATKKRTRLTPTEKVKDLTNMQSETDVNGSYTGTPADKRENPMQDADDL